MQEQLAAVYGIEDRFLVHPMMRVPAGMWVVRPPFEIVDARSLAEAAMVALGRSRALTEDVDTTKAQDAELIRAAGFRSRKRFVQSVSMCTVSREAGGSEVLQIRGNTRAPKGSSWLPDQDAIEVGGSNLAEVAAAITSVLAR